MATRKGEASQSLGRGRRKRSSLRKQRAKGPRSQLPAGARVGPGTGQREAAGLTPAGPPRTARYPDGGKARTLMAGAGPELSLSLSPPHAPPRGCQQEAALPWLRLLLSQEAPGRRQRAIPAAAPVSSFSLCPSGTASFALKAVNVWSHSSPFSLAALRVSRSQPDQ